MSGPGARDQDALEDLVTWAIRDAMRRDVGHSAPPDPYLTLGALGYGNPVDIRKILGAADEELEYPRKYKRPANIVSAPYRINFAHVDDAFISNCIGMRADQIAGFIVGHGLLLSPPTV